MKLLGPARQPFIGLAVAAAAGIGLGDFLAMSPRLIVTGAILAAICAIALLWRPNVLITYIFVFCSFVLLHTLRTTATPGLLLSERLGERPRMIAVTGAVVSEPKVP